MPWLQIVVGALLDHRCPGSGCFGYVAARVRSWPRKLLLHFLSLARLLPTAHSTSCPTLYYTTDVEREARTLRSLRETNRAYVVGGASRRRRQAAAAGNVLRPAA